MSHVPRPEPLSEHHWQQVLEQMTGEFTAQEILRALSAVYLSHNEEEQGDWFNYLAVELSETAEAIDTNWEGPEGTEGPSPKP